MRHFKKFAPAFGQWHHACGEQVAPPSPNANHRGGRRLSITALVNTVAVGTLDEQQLPDRLPLQFHRRLPGYEETPLVHAPGLADALGVGKVLVKDESSRLGLPAFKVLGASWAVYRALEERLPEVAFEDWETVEALKEKLEPLRPLDLVAATDGNHGRALARVARLLGLGAKIFVPEGMAAARREAIAGEGAEVIVVEGTYDEAVERSAAEEGESGLVVSDTSWSGYERIPSWVIEGYSTMLWEIDDELERRKEAAPDLVVVQIGVGAFAILSGEITSQNKRDFHVGEISGPDDVPVDFHVFTGTRYVPFNLRAPSRPAQKPSRHRIDKTHLLDARERRDCR